MQCSVPKACSGPFVEAPGRFQRAAGRLCRPYLGALTAVQLENGDFLLQFDVPGIADEQISVTFENGHLVLSGERTLTAPDDAKVLHTGQPCSTFRRVLQIDDNIDTDNIDAELSNGVLSIRLSPKPDPPQQKITIRSTN